MDRHDLDRELVELERRLDRRWRRRLVVTVLAALAVAVPGGVLASHQFTDVPTSHTFHGDISRVSGAAITAGCDAGKYCPGDGVTRGQMAAFLARTGGRVAYDSNGFQFSLSSTEVEMAAVTIRGSNVAGGTVFVQLQASGYVYTNSNNETGCAPCNAQFIIVKDGGPGLAPNVRFSVMTVTNVSASAQEFDASTITFVVPVATGIDHTFRLMATRTYGTGQVNGIASLSATYFPFSGDGDATMP